MKVEKIALTRSVDIQTRGGRSTSVTTGISIVVVIPEYELSLILTVLDMIPSSGGQSQAQ